MKELLEDWLEFSKDIVASDFAGNEQLEILRHKTQESIKAIPIEPPVMQNFADIKIEIARMIDEYERKRISSNDRPTRISFEGSIVGLIELRDNLSKISA